MTRSDFLRRLAALGVLPLVAACKSPAGASPPSDSVAAASGLGAVAIPEPDQRIAPLRKTEAQWRAILDDDAFNVLRREGTARPWSSEYNAEKRAGTFVCAGCMLPLFLSRAKFESGTGWPSFYTPIAGNISTKRDTSLPGPPRIEYHCTRCGGHQGHVFEDGPRPTGLRYCNNGVALRFVPQGQALPALRT